MLIGLNTTEAIRRQIPFFNTQGSYYYIKLKLSLCNDVIFYHSGGMTINGEVYIPDVLDSVSELSRRLKIPKSSIGRAIQSIADDGGYIERVGSHGRGVKYKIVLEPDKAKEFIDHYHSTLATKKIKKKARTWSKRSDWDINKFSKVG